MTISVIICTYNRCESLKDTLDSLLTQECDDSFNYEIIIVDNNSRDSTKEVVESYIPKFNGKLRYIFESNQGLSYARNRGINEAEGKIIAFTDNDCIPEKKWISKIWLKFYEDKRLDGILGNAFWENGNAMYNDKDLLRGNGLNMSFRRTLFQNIGDFNVHLGAGSVGYSADDTEFIYRTVKEKKKIIIDDEIVVLHKHRLNQKEILKIFSRDIKGYVIFWLQYVIMKHDSFALRKIYWFTLRALSDLITGIKDGNKKQVHSKIRQILGIFVGLLKGFYIWLFLVPVKTLCQKLV